MMCQLSFFPNFLFDLEAIVICCFNIIIMSNKETPSDNLGHQQLWVDSYTWPKCIFEFSYLSASMYLWWILVQQTIKLHIGPLPVVLGLVAALFFVDFISGMLHWAADTWGKFETPIFGPGIIRSFRMHHVNPQDITKHSFVQTNASSSYPVPVVVGFALWLNNSTFGSQTFSWMMIFGVVVGIMTNECHKWAHMVDTKPNAIIRFLQNSGLIISHQKHHKHHTGQFDSDYCIINGWMNPLLDRIGYWRWLETTITKITGFKPRVDDQYWRMLKEKNEKCL